MTGYCVKCRRNTSDVNPHIVRTKNGRSMQKSKCSTCHGNKCQFVSGASGGRRKRASGGNLLSDIAGMLF